MVQSHIQKAFPQLQTTFLIEQNPLGTGGAIALACKQTTDETVLVVNGDTFFKCQLLPAFAMHQQFKSCCSILLKPMRNYNRFGSVEINNEQQIIGFIEKKNTIEGRINTGHYILDVAQFLQHEFAQTFSFENHFLEQYFSSIQMHGIVQDDYFIDIGTPEDLEKAQTELPLQLPFLPNASSTLFLDRDGVINLEKHQDYIHHWDEFVFYPDAAKTVARLSNLFKRTIVVTNQKGIGKGVTLEENVIHIHQKLAEAVAAEGGKIDAFFYAPDLDSNSPNRKPNPGMALQAKQKFPSIDFANSLMVGNNLSDLYFGRNAGMQTAFLRTTKPNILLPKDLADVEARDLNHLLQILTTPI